MLVKQETRQILKYLFFAISYAVIIYLAFILAYFVRFYTFIPIFKGLPPFILYHKGSMFIAVVWVVLFFQSGFFDRTNFHSVEDILGIMKVMFLGTVFVLSVNFFYRDYLYSRLVIILGVFFTIILLFLFHQLIRWVRWIRSIRNRDHNRILVIGRNRIAKIIKNRIRKKLLGRVSFYPYSDYKKLNTFLVKNNISEVIIASHNITRDELNNIVNLCDKFSILCKFIPDILEIRMGQVSVDTNLEFPVLQMRPASFLQANFLKKRLFDIFVSMCILTVNLIPLLIIFVLIKITSKGPCFYKQQRVGLNGRVFDFYKFRTMVVDADKLLAKLQHLNEREGSVFKMKNDPRMTWVGRVLRKYSLDEFPQFINVLQGQMSVVGPRPQIIWEVKNLDDTARRRLSVFPGITGIWQISGRSDLSFEEMITLDIYYLENWSISMDIKIILNTVPAILLAKGAY